MVCDDKVISGRLRPGADEARFWAGHGDSTVIRGKPNIARGLPRSGPRSLCLLVLGAVLAFAGATPAHADEIVVRDLTTGATSSINVWGITSESWSEVTYKERERSAAKSVPTITVVRIKRNDKSASAGKLRQAIASLNRRNYREAADAFQAINGGGTKADLETGENKFVSFSENDPKGRNKRPSWISEYSHFYYAKSKYLQGAKSNDRSDFQEALYSLDDVKIPGGEGTTGGFLGRFANGNSRFYPEALALKANVLTKLARYDDAKKTFSELDGAAIKVPLLPRWLYEGSIGAGVIAEAQANLTGAVSGYNAASNKMWVMLGKERRKWLLAEVGRYISKARTRTSAVPRSSSQPTTTIRQRLSQPIVRRARSSLRCTSAVSRLGKIRVNRNAKTANRM